jgi:hypothetical protein
MAPRKLIPDDLPAIPKSGVVRTRKERILAKANELAKRDREATPASRGPATRGGVRSMKATAGGTGPKAKSSSGGGGSGNFKSSFAQARKAGKASFTWNGKSYHTKTAEEMGGSVKAKSSSNKAAAKPDPNPGTRRNQGMLGSERPARATPRPVAKPNVPPGADKMRAAAAKAFWTQPGVTPGNQYVAGPPVQAGTPLEAIPSPRTATGRPAPLVTARDPVVAPPASAAPPPMRAPVRGPAIANPRGDPVVGAANAVGQRIADAPRRWGERAATAAGAVGGALHTAVGGRPAHGEIFQPGQQVPGARTGPVSPGEAAATVAAGKSRPKRTPQQEDEDDGKTLASFLRKKREGR